MVKTPTNSPVTINQRGRFYSFFGKLAPWPGLARDLFVLAVKVTFAVFVASVRLIVPPGKKSLLGETVLITDAGHGIGRELALQLAAQGCIVVCWDTDVAANLATLSVISKNGGEAHGFLVDVSQRLEVREAVRLMRKANIPDVSILINNAAILTYLPFLEHKAEDIQRMFEVNVLSQFWTVQAFLPSMLQNKKGHVVSICSLCGYYGLSNKVPYCSSEFAARGLMEGLIEELRLTATGSKINFTSVHPLYVDSELAESTKYSAVPPKYAAEEVIRAVQRNYEECTIPGCFFYLNTVNRILPKSAARFIIDFLENLRR